jgi:hypothetical protein
MTSKWLASLALLPMLALPQVTTARPLDDAIKAQFTKLQNLKAKPALTPEQHRKLENWLAQADGKGLVPIDHNDPRDVEGLDLFRRLSGYQSRTDYLKAIAKVQPKTALSRDDSVCSDFLAKYQSNGLFLDLGRKDDSLMATALQANADDGLPKVAFGNLLTVIDSNKKAVTSGDGLGDLNPILVTYAPPQPGAYDPNKPPRAAAEFTVFKEDGTPCSYRDVKSMMAWPSSINVQAPNNTRTNSKTVLCLNRANPDPSWPQACDFGPFPQAKHDSGWAVIVPQQGEILLPSPVKIKTDGSVDADLRVTAINSNNGITCQGQNVDVGKTVLAASKVDPNNSSKVTWSLLADQAPTFGQTCYDAHTGLNFNMYWNVRTQAGPVTAIVSNTLTQGSYNTLIVPAVDLQFGCLPAGTQVTLANGEKKAIEAIINGDLVLGSDGKPWEVVNRMVGEDLSLVEILGANGTIVKASVTHPIIIGHETDGRPRAQPAAKIQAGTALITAAGMTTVLSATRIFYDGPVYNIAIRPQGSTEMPEGGAFYADGVLVGDQIMQGMNEPTPARNNKVKG